MNTPLTELQQFFGSYFHQDWAEEYPSADDAIDSYLLNSSSNVIIIVKKEILELIHTYTTELDLQSKLLEKQHCYYYPYHLTSGLSWLNHIVEKFDEHLLKQTLKSNNSQTPKNQ